MQYCPLTWVRGRPWSHWKPILHHSKHPLCRIHHYAGPYVRLLFLIQVKPFADFCASRDRNMFLSHIRKPTVYLLVCIVYWGPISILTGVTHDLVGALLTRFFLGICECVFFPVSHHWRMFCECSHGMAESLVPPFEMVQAQ